MARVAINGLGRIGRATLKIVLDTPELELVAANDLWGAENIAYLLKFDTVYGRYERPVEARENALGVAEDPIVSSDIIGDPRASVVDLGMTRVVDGDLVKVLAWYDNEWGYSAQMVREAVAMVGSSLAAEAAP